MFAVQWGSWDFRKCETVAFDLSTALAVQLCARECDTNFMAG